MSNIQSGNLARDVLERLIHSSEELFALEDSGIEGLNREIPNPEIDIKNGINGSRYVPFPSHYQFEGGLFILDKKRSLIADDMGVGKTAQPVIAKILEENRTGKQLRTIAITTDMSRLVWANEIPLYVERPQKILDLRNYTDPPEDEMHEADFTILNYDIFGNVIHRESITEMLMDQGFGLCVLDEVQNAKNPYAFRSGNIKRIADTCKYLSLLSGTELPDSIEDVYMIIALLENDIYKDTRVNGKTIPAAEMVKRTHRDNPRLLRSILEKRRLKRRNEDVLNLPTLNRQYTPYLEMTPKQREIYNTILENEDLEGSIKLMELRKALIDPKLVDPDLIKGIDLNGAESAKYLELDRILGEVCGDEKVLIFSPMFKTGVTRELQERYARYGALRIDGDVTGYKKREKIRRSFQRDPDKRILIATDVAGEGISLTAASQVIFIDDPYSPGNKKQQTSRSYRRGQTRDVTVRTLGIKGTVDEGVCELLGLKQEGIDFMENGLPLKQEHINVLGSEPVSLSKPIRKWLYTPQQEIRRESSKMVGKGSKKIERYLEGKMGRFYAENYVRGWETSYSANVARALKVMIDGLSGKIDLTRKIDLGSGFGVLSKVLGERMTNVDINPHSFEQVLADQNNRNIVSSIHDVPLDELFDLATCSLALYYTSLEKNDKGVTERERALREANRLLPYDGTYMLTMPPGIVEGKGAEILPIVLDYLGFEAAPELNGYIRADSRDSDFQVYSAVARKVRESPHDALDREALVLNSDRRGKGKRQSYSSKRTLADRFIIRTMDGQEDLLEHHVQGYLDRIGESV